MAKSIFRSNFTHLRRLLRGIDDTFVMIRKIYIFALFYVFESPSVDSFRDFISSESNDRHNLYFTNQSRILKRVSSSLGGKELAGEESARVDTTGFDLPIYTLDGLYSKCIFNFSFTCLQNRIIKFLYELDKVENFQFLNKSIMLVRKKNAPLNAIIMPLKRVDGYVNRSNYLKNVIDALIERFFDNRFVRIKLPANSFMFSYNRDDATRENSNDFHSMYIDIDFEKEPHSSSMREGKCILTSSETKSEVLIWL